MVAGAHRAVTGGRVSGRIRVGFPSEFDTDFGADSSLVDLFFLLEKPILFLSGSLLVHALPLPLVYAAGEGAWPPAHGAREDESAEELREGSMTLQKDRRVHLVLVEI